MSRKGSPAVALSSGEALAKLELFNEKARLLERSRFLLWLKRGPRRPDFAKIVAGDWLAYADLDPEHVAAFCLWLRLLIQPRDRHSIDDIPSYYAQLGDENGEAKRLAEKALSELNLFLDSDSLVQLGRGRDRTTNRQVFEIIFYGGIAHSNEDKLEDCHRLTRRGPIAVFAFSVFVNAGRCFMTCISRMAAMNAVILKHHARARSDGN